ncbi:MAG TPA: hypothetical protein VM536_08765, partial [Chloroflexia bacterium]|nr:hypothetical protein [Chloroflexia bacterium]
MIASIGRPRGRQPLFRSLLLALLIGLSGCVGTPEAATITPATPASAPTLALAPAGASTSGPAAHPPAAAAGTAAATAASEGAAAVTTPRPAVSEPATAVSEAATAAPTVTTAVSAAATAAPSSPTAACRKLNLNTVTADQLLAAIPGFSARMTREFAEYKPYASILQFRREIGKYVNADQVAEYEKYVYVPIDPNESDAAT